jgi:ATP-binding cassette subfamily F protein 3
MSGGEKARCALALLAWHRPNLLVLDEPTNHLDMETREALTMALSSFEGALLLVSHDRHLLRAATDELWLVTAGSARPYDGDLDDYAALVLASRRAREPASQDPSADSKRDLRKEQARERQRLASARKPLQARLQKVEAEMSAAADDLRGLDARLADPTFYHEGDVGEVAAIMKRRGDLSVRLEGLERQWLDLTAQFEALGQERPAQA